MYWYLGIWIFLCLAATGIAVKTRASLRARYGKYWSFLFVHWKIATFLLAAGALVFTAPYSRDPSWDAVDSVFMSVFTFVLIYVAPFCAVFLAIMVTAVLVGRAGR